MSDLNWWNSIDVLSRWTDRLTGGAAVLGLLAGIAALGAWHLGARLGELKDAEIAQLRSRTEARHISDRAALVQRLPRVDWAKSPAYMFVSGYDTEAREYAEELRQLLAEAGWSVSSSGGGYFPSTPGVAILLPAVEHPTFAAAATVKEVLREAGILTHDPAERPAEAKRDEMVILVGRRP